MRYPSPGCQHGSWREVRNSPPQHLREQLLVFAAPGQGGVSQPSPCQDKPQSVPVPRLGWAGALHNAPQPGLPCFARGTRSQNAALSALPEGPGATHPWGKGFGWTLKTQGRTPPYAP